MDAVAKRERGCWPFTTNSREFLLGCKKKTFFLVRPPLENSRDKRKLWKGSPVWDVPHGNFLTFVHLVFFGSKQVGHITFIEPFSSTWHGESCNTNISTLPYLVSRQQFVNVEEGISSRRPLLRGVPQGSLLGSLLYLVYTAPIADIIKKHDLLYHLYADDTQLYISFNTDCCADLDEAKLRVERCVEEIDLWMCKL